MTTRAAELARRDHGSASLWVLGCAALLIAVATFGVVRGVAVLARHRAEATADLAALAAADRIGLAQDECAAARRVAERNGARVVGCRVRLRADPRVGVVDVRVAVDATLPMIGTEAVVASARAGRLPAATLSGRSVPRVHALGIPGLAMLASRRGTGRARHVECEE